MNEKFKRFKARLNLRRLKVKAKITKILDSPTIGAFFEVGVEIVVVFLALGFFRPYTVKTVCVSIGFYFVGRHLLRSLMIMIGQRS